MRSMRNFTRFSATLVAVFSAGIVACGDDDPAATDTTTPDTSDTSVTPDADATPPDSTPETTPDVTTDPNPCTTAPGARCSSDNMGVVTSTGPGTCTASGATASCAYAETTTACGTDKVCAAGACVDTGDACDYTFGDRVSYVTEIKVVTAPVGAPTANDCCFDFTDDGKNDNALGNLLNNALVLQAFNVNMTLEEQIADGGLVLLLETLNVTNITASSGVTVNGFYGADGDADVANNAFGTSPFIVNPSSFATGTAQPIIAFTDATIASSTLTAGPSIFRLSIPLLGASLDLAINGTRFESSVEEGELGLDKGLAMGGADGGKLGGYVGMRDLAAAFNTYLNAECTCVSKKNDALEYVTVNTGATSETLNVNIKDGTACTGVDEDTCKTAGDALGDFGAILGGLLTPDIDANEDGVKESLSVGVRLKATSATISGVAECTGE